MDDYSDDDLKQLFAITTENEYICINITLFQKILDLVNSTSPLSNTLKSKLISELNQDLSNLVIISNTLNDYNKEKYIMPSILNIDFTTDNIIIQFKELFTNCKKLLNIMNASMNTQAKIQHTTSDYIKNSESKMTYYINLLSEPTELNSDPIKKQVFKPKQMFQRKPPQTSPIQTIERPDTPKSITQVPETISNIREKINDEYIQPTNVIQNEPYNILEITPQCISKIGGSIHAIADRFHSTLTELEAKLSLIQSCKKSMQDFKDKGLDVDTTLIPLETQETEIKHEMLDIINKFNNATIRLQDIFGSNAM
jgi:hypothetical protein